MKIVNIVNIVQIVLAVLLIISILLQQRGTSLGGAFGGDSSIYRSRRGVEKFLFISSIVVAVLFVGAAVVSVVLR
jgi:preprotein translocase subunit SecG